MRRMPQDTDLKQLAAFRGKKNIRVAVTFRPLGSSNAGTTSNQQLTSNNQHTMTTPLRFAAIGLLFTVNSAMAQIPNGGFENWTSFGDYEDPTGWASLNVLASLTGAELSCQQVSGAVGSYGASVTTVNVPGIGLLPGLLLSGDPVAAADGFPTTLRPQALNGKWKVDVETGDQASVTITFSRWDAIAQEREIIGTGTVVVGTNVATWTNFSVPITYASSATPDTASIAILSSLGAGVAGSTISVDDLSFGAAVGIAEEFAGTVNVWPVPATDVLTISASATIATVELVATDGRLVKQLATLTDRVQLDIAELSVGTYVLVARMADGTSFRRTVVKN